MRRVAGVVVTPKNESLRAVIVIARTATGDWRTVTNDDGEFRLEAPNEDLALRVEGPYVVSQEKLVPGGTPAEDLRIETDVRIPRIHQSIVITASSLEPQVQTYSDEVYRKTLFSRDDQLLETLNGGINAGQHEGGGKSLEVRRFGFNLDHGGVNGGLKVLVDNVQQNQGTQGHGQGYLGALKSLTPELVHEVHMLNGPFSAEYGDFSGLGVIHIRLRESLPEQWTARFQRGPFDSYRTFVGYSPSLDKSDAFLAYEGSRTDGPFLNPLRYRRDNGGLTLSGWRAFHASLRYRHIGNYRLDGEDPTIRASGLDVLDLAVTKTIRPWLDLNLNIDNLTDKTYYETQNYFASRVSPAAPIVERIHGTPGYPIGVTLGLPSDLGRRIDGDPNLMPGRPCPCPTVDAVASLQPCCSYILGTGSGAFLRPRSACPW